MCRRVAAAALLMLSLLLAVTPPTVAAKKRGKKNSLGTRHHSCGSTLCLLASRARLTCDSIHHTRGGNAEGGRHAEQTSKCRLELVRAPTVPGSPAPPSFRPRYSTLKTSARIRAIRYLAALVKLSTKLAHSLYY